MNKINNPQGYGFWKGHIEGYEQSGLSQEEYCAQAGISLNRFRYQYEGWPVFYRKGPFYVQILIIGNF